MGVTLASKNKSVDLSYTGFDRFRQKIATLAHVDFGTHYASFTEVDTLSSDEEKDAFCTCHDAKTHTLMETGLVSAEVANFCYQSGDEGEIDQNQAEHIYELMEGVTENFVYGYVARPDCATFQTIREVFLDCAKHGGTVEWY